TRNRALRQMLHQPDVEGHFLAGDALDQREHPPATLGIDEVVGVLDPLGDAASDEQAPDVVAFGPGLELGFRDGCECGHSRRSARTGPGPCPGLAGRRHSTALVEAPWARPLRPVDRLSTVVAVCAGVRHETRRWFARFAAGGS